MKVPVSIQPFLKAVAPAVLTVLAVLIDWAINGSFNKQTLTIAITGLAAAIVTYFVPNTQPLVPTEPPVTTPASPSSRQGKV